MLFHLSSGGTEAVEDAENNSVIVAVAQSASAATEMSGTHSCDGKRPNVMTLRLTLGAPARIPRAFDRPGQSAVPMRVRNSLRSAKVRDKNCRVVRRRGRVYVINKKNPRMKVRQG